MAIKTMSHSSGSGIWAEGWHKLAISKAEYGDWNGTKYLDVRFEGYPDTFKLRVYSAENKETHEEFALTRFFKLTNAGIIDKIKSPSGKEAIQYDDDESELIGKELHGYFYKDGDFVRVSDRIAPVAQDGKILSYNDENVDFWKSVAEKHVKEYVKKSTPAVSSTTTTDITSDDIPF